MTVVRTVENMRVTRERARNLRFEPTGALTATNVQKAIEQSASQPQAITITSVAFADSPYTPSNNDTYIEVDTAGGAVTINLQAASARAGLALVIKDSTGHANANNISLVASGAETTDSLATYPINSDFGGARLVPKSGTGYRVSP